MRKEWSYEEVFERMLQAEYRERQERSGVLLTKTAGFPAIKTLEQVRVHLRNRSAEIADQRKRSVLVAEHWSIFFKPRQPK